MFQVLPYSFVTMTDCDIDMVCKMTSTCYSGPRVTAVVSTVALLTHEQGQYPQWLTES